MSNTQRYHYDSAGRMADMEPALSVGMTASARYDGDSLRVKWVENSAATYYIRSSVLGGQVVTELNVSGQKLRGYVYGQGRVLAKQEGSQTLWEHIDPAVTSVRMINEGSFEASRVELDPLGVVTDTGGASVNPVGYYGEPSNPSTGCYVDGLPTPCSTVQRLVNNGAAVRVPEGGETNAVYNASTGKYEIIARFKLTQDSDAGRLPLDGFKEHLIAGEQNGGVWVHITGIAGAYLAGQKWVIDKQFREDNNQLKMGLDFKAMGRTTINYAGDDNYSLDKFIDEKRAELEDDKAGLFVGDLLYAKVKGKKTAQVVQIEIFNRLCDK